MRPRLFSKRLRSKYHKYNSILKTIKEISENEIFSYAISKGDFLNDLRDNANANFLEVVKNKGIERIKIEFRERLNEYNNRVKMYLKKAKTEVEEYQRKYNQLKLDYDILDLKLTNVNEENSKLRKQINELSLNLTKQDMEMSLIHKEKQLIDAFLEEFPGSQPIQIIKEINRIREGAEENLRRANGLERENQRLKSSLSSIKSAFSLRLSKLSSLLDSEKLETEAKISKLNLENSDLEVRLSRAESRAKENGKLRNEIFHVFNLLFPKSVIIEKEKEEENNEKDKGTKNKMNFEGKGNKGESFRINNKNKNVNINTEKNLKINAENKGKLLENTEKNELKKLIKIPEKPLNIQEQKRYLDLKKSDFVPEIFRDAEMTNYLSLIAETRLPESAAKVLRQVIAYANMMLRTFAPEKVNLRFKPVEIFSELKKLLTEKNDKIYSLECKLDQKNQELKLLNKSSKINEQKLKTEQKKFKLYSNIVDKIYKKNIDEYLYRPKSSNIFRGKELKKIKFKDYYTLNMTSNGYLSSQRASENPTKAPIRRIYSESLINTKLLLGKNDNKFLSFTEDSSNKNNKENINVNTNINKKNDKNNNKNDIIYHKNHSSIPDLKSIEETIKINDSLTMNENKNIDVNKKRKIEYSYWLKDKDIKNFNNELLKNPFKKETKNINKSSNFGQDNKNLVKNYTFNNLPNSISPSFSHSHNMKYSNQKILRNYGGPRFNTEISPILLASNNENNRYIKNNIDTNKDNLKNISKKNLKICQNPDFIDANTQYLTEKVSEINRQFLYLPRMNGALWNNGHIPKFNKKINKTKNNDNNINVINTAKNNKTKLIINNGISSLQKDIIGNINCLIGKIEKINKAKEWEWDNEKIGEE